MLFALGGYLLFSFGDAFLKLGAGLWAPIAIGAVRYAIGAVVLGLFLAWREGRAGFVVRHPVIQLVRGISLGVSMAAFVVALRFMPLVDATAIGFTSPVITALIAAKALDEPVGARTWAAIFAGFAGVLIVLRPNLVDLGPVALLPLVTATGVSLLVIGNRMVAGSGSGLAMQFFASVPAAFTLAALTFAGHLSGVDYLHVGPLPGVVFLICCGVALSATTGHWLVYHGTTKAGASTVAPMTYIQILGATGMGFLMFRNVPDLPAIVGSAIIILAGLVLWQGKRPVILADETG